MKAHPQARLPRALASVALLVLVAACNQIVGIHSGILTESDGDATTTDGGKMDAPVDAHTDTVVDSTVDSTTPTDTSPPSDSSIAMEADAPIDAPGDAVETGVDTGSEASSDSAVTDAPADACSGQVCNDLCVPTDDIHNCGACANDCTMLPNVVGPTCSGTQCGYTSCAAGFANCGSGAGCPVNLTVQGNCGACGTTCSGADPVCVSSGSSAACGTGCTGSQMLCSGSCVDVSSNNVYCGNCQTSCIGGTICTGGNCLCPGSAPSTCAAMCVDTTANNMYCGTSCTTCTGGTSCVNSACTCPGSAPTVCSGVCTDTTSNNAACGPSCTPCTGGQVCMGTTCSCPGAAPTLCGGTCVDCTGGEVCNGTACACPAGDHLCSGTCVSNSSINSCGASCGACPSMNGTASCNGTSCGLVCNGGFTLCSGACTSTLSDASNCGACGVSCLGGTCSSGVCQPYLVASGNFIIAIATDGTNIVWTDSGNHGVFEVPVAGGAVTALGTNGNWTELGGVGVLGGVAAFLVGGSPPTLWTANEGVATSAVQTPAALSLPSGAAPLEGFAMTGSGYAFILAINGLYDTYNCTLPVTSSSCTVVQSRASFGGLQMATGGGNFFWTDRGTSPPGGAFFANVSTPASVNTVAGFAGSNYIAADSTYVYWVAGSAIYKALQEASAPTDTQLASQIPPTAGGGLLGLATDGKKVYFTNNNSGANYVGSIPITASGGGTANITTLATSPDSLGQIVFGPVGSGGVIAWIDNNSSIHALRLQ